MPRLAPTKHAPEPGTERCYPWRFKVGDYVHVLNAPREGSFQVVGGELWMGCPHLHCQALDGSTWRIPQLRCSAKPITFQKG